MKHTAVHRVRFVTCYPNMYIPACILGDTFHLSISTFSVISKLFVVAIKVRCYVIFRRLHSVIIIFSAFLSFMYYISAGNSVGHFLMEREDMSVIFIVLMEF